MLYLEKESGEQEKKQEDGFLPLLALPLMMKSVTARGYNGSYG